MLQMTKSASIVDMTAFLATASSGGGGSASAVCRHWLWNIGSELLFEYTVDSVLWQVAGAAGRDRQSS